jgi:hypothetical protein
VASWASPWLSRGLAVTLGFLKARFFGLLKIQMSRKEENDYIR